MPDSAPLPTAKLSANIAELQVTTGAVPGLAQGLRDQQAVR